MFLVDLWFWLIALTFTLYFFLEGFDFGVGMLVPVLRHDDSERRVVINTIGPHFDGNEVWLIVAGGVAYITGAVFYALQAPTTHREWFGFHELFHAFTVAGFVCHAVAIYRAVLVVA